MSTFTNFRGCPATEYARFRASKTHVRIGKASKVQAINEASNQLAHVTFCLQLVNATCSTLTCRWIEDVQCSVRSPTTVMPKAQNSPGTKARLHQTYANIIRLYLAASISCYTWLTNPPAQSLPCIISNQGIKYNHYIILSNINW